MDVKADPANPGEFSWVCGGIDGELVRNVRNSIDLLASWDWEGEVVFRTTVLPGYNYAYLRRILSYLEKRGVSPTQFYLNPFRFTGVRISRSWLDDCHRRWGSSVVATEAQVREWEQALQKGESAFSGASHPEEYSKRVG
jgi:pyruvate-formate lyase-activating enzyme